MSGWSVILGPVPAIKEISSHVTFSGCASPISAKILQDPRAAVPCSALSSLSVRKRRVAQAEGGG